MSVTEGERAALRTALTEEIGEESADVLMRSTLPQGSDQLATKDDIDALGTRVEGEFAKVHGKLDGGFARVHDGFAKVHAQLDGESAKAHDAFREYESESPVAKHSRGMLFAMAGFMVTIWVTLMVAFIVLTSR